MSGSITIFYGALINPIDLDSYQALPRCLLCVGITGNIEWLIEDVEPHNLQETLAQKGCFDENLVELKEGEFIMPGFIDTHTHAPQVPNLGIGGQYELLDWLENVTFPMEAKFEDATFAHRTYNKVVRRIIDSGTTTCCYYGTIHLQGTKILADIVHKLGQRAFVGKCNMNRNSPENYIEKSPSKSIDDTKSLISHIHSLPIGPTVHASMGTHPHPIVQPILTPRFAISCTSELLSSLGHLASDKPSLRIQTHISENRNEVKFVRELFPDADSYAATYDTHGLLRANTILAHAVYLEDGECKLIKERDAGISHCPTSNFNLSSGIAPVGKFLDMGIKVGLGTDVSGGFSPSILNAIQNASIASKVVSFTATSPVTSKYTNVPLSISSLLYLATLGGARVCTLDSRVGSFGNGKSFDALLVNVRSDAGNPGMWATDVEAGDTEATKTKLEANLERFLFTGDDRNISRVYVQGRIIGGRTFH